LSITRLQIETFSVGQLKANCYLVFDPETKEALLIDPGEAPEFLAQKIIEEKLKLKYLIATHGHFDHVLAVGVLKAIFKTSFLMNKKDQKLLNKMNDSASYWLGIKSRYPVAEVNQNLEEGQILKLGKKSLKVIETPGHTPGGICLLGQKILFSGDTLFLSGIGRTDYSYSDKDQMKKSLQKLLKLPAATIVYPGHGSITSIKNEKMRLK